MLATKRLLMLGLLGVGITGATTAQAGSQLFEGWWLVRSFGNDRTGGTGDSEFYQAVGIPQGNQCLRYQPRCAFTSTPTDGAGNFAPLGGSQAKALYCAPWANWQSMGTTARPAKGQTALDAKDRPIPPLYRNPAFFTSSGQPNTTVCNFASSGATPGGKGLVQAGHPVTGTWSAATTTGGGFSFNEAPPNHAAGIRTTGVIGSIGGVYPYVYSYTYATFRNDGGVFGPGMGPGNFNVPYKVGNLTVASARVTQGAAKFGGTMRMLGGMNTKVCYYRNGGCMLGGANWRYDVIGASAYTSGGVVTAGYIITYQAYYYHTALMQQSTISLQGSRFPWTTGSVTITALERGALKTIEYERGYDNRSVGGEGMIKLVSPTITRWLGPAVSLDLGGIGILRLKFVPEPQRWVVLVAGASLLGLGFRMRER
jgi:hypothetical protein